MATVKDTFNGVISEAIKNADLIIDNYQKAMVYASIAQALASTGLVGEITNEAPSAPVVEIPVEKQEKTADRLKRQPKDLPPDEPESPKAPEKEFKEWTEEWTDEAVAHFSNELEYITTFTEEWGEEAANVCLAEFSDGVLKDIASDVNPMNIEAIVAAFQEFAAEAEQDK